MKIRRWLWLSVALGACGPGRSAGPPAEILALPSDTVATEWGNLPVAAWIGDATWAVVASEWDAADVLDFGTRKLSPLGGPAPKAYAHPLRVFAMGDTVFLADWGFRRSTVWADGKLVDSIPFPSALRGVPIRARDRAGQLYFEVPPPPLRDGSGNLDSAAIVRGSAGLTRFDTVARLAPMELAEMRRENANRFEQRVLSGRDLWGVWPDGTVWIARVGRNQLVTVDPRGKRTTGPELPDPVYEVTQADRDQYLQEFPAEVRPRETDLPFALIHPPFVAAFAAPDGMIWLEKSKVATDSIRRIHVLDRAGTLRRVLELHGQARLLGVGAQAILLAERDPAGVRLMRGRIPRSPPPADSAR